MMESPVLDLNPAVVLAASLVLVGVAVGVSVWLRLGVERSIIVASVRAAIQLIAVGVLLTLVIDSGWEEWLAPLWIIVMVAIATYVVTQRAGTTAIAPAAALAIGMSTAISLAVVFGIGVLPAEPIQMIVIAGITIGNVMPATVVGADQVRKQLTDGRAVIEGLLSLGVDANRSTRFMVSEAVRVALIPQIERTKVVGLIALPGAFTGLLLAGVAPLDAAVVQLVVMYLVLGSVAVSTSTIATVTARSAFTPDQRLKSVEELGGN
jgi:putative ABC transport system permease protein